jgi:phosphotransferase system  glucose/maltose/N-acetylglucosamine-specific IIC component
VNELTGKKETEHTEETNMTLKSLGKLMGVLTVIAVLAAGSLAVGIADVFNPRVEGTKALAHLPWQLGDEDGAEYTDHFLGHLLAHLPWQLGDDDGAEYTDHFLGHMIG